MCAVTCMTDADCPSGGVCLTGVDPPEEMFPDGGVGPTLPNLRGCYARCNDDFDCSYGFACTTDAVGGTSAGRICVPD
jgi:hypothetical protein